MAVAISSVTRLGYRAWRYVWGATTGPYRVVRDGLTVATVTETQYDVVGTDAGEPPALEIRDATDGLAASELHPPYAVIQWRGNPEASVYVVERLDGAAWVEVDSVAESGLGYYTYASKALGDGVVQFRVTAKDVMGQSSEVVYARAQAVCAPEVPRIALSYAGGVLTVGARE